MNMLPATRPCPKTMVRCFNSEPPLVIDLDGTLVRSDLLLETGIVFLKTHPERVFQVFFWLYQGKAKLKDGLARATNIDVSVLPYDQAIIQFIETERKRGRKVVLATASHYTLAEQIAEHLQLFDEVIATDATHNLSAHRKRDALVQNYGERGFDYAGNSHADVLVWGSARRAYVVNPHAGVEKRSRRLGNVQEVMRSYKPTLRDWSKALRLHQWLKNLLIFVPLLAAHRVSEVALLTQALMAFLFFGLCASSVYLLNDLADLDDDRYHPTKRERPFAAGRLSIDAGLIAFPLLLIAAFAGALWLLPVGFSRVLAVYYALTLAYSLVLKRQMVVDVIALALLYTLRVVAGGAACELTLSFWMLAFSIFMFLSLAMVKRHTELRGARARGEVGQGRGRGYYPDDLGMIATLGAAAGYMATMVLALYINDLNAAALYRNPQFIWLACPLLLLWVSRVWILANRGQIDDDPVVFAIRDRASLIIGALFGLVFWAAI